MGRRNQVYNHSIDVYKQPAARKVVLFVGFGISLAALVVTILAALSFFVTGVGESLSASLGQPVLAFEKILCWIGIATSFVGAVLSVAGANACKPIARLCFFFTIISFFMCIAILVFSYLGMYIADVIS